MAKVDRSKGIKRGRRCRSYKFSTYPGEWNECGRWRVILQETSEELGIPYGHVKRIIFAWWWYVKEMIGNVQLPRVILPFFGRLYPSEAKLYSYCQGKEGVVRRGDEKYGYSNERWMEKRMMLNDEIEVYHRSYFRLLSERESRSEKIGAMKGVTDVVRAEFFKTLRSPRIIETTIAEARAYRESIGLSGDYKRDYEEEE